MQRIAIVSPIVAMRSGLESLLLRHLEPERIFHAAHLDELGSLKNIDLILLSYEDGLLDFEPALLDGLDSPPAVLILSDSADDARLVNDLGFSCWGLLPLESSEQEILAAVAALAEGLIVASPLLLNEQLLGSRDMPAPINAEYIEDLTPRETEVLEAMAQGLANKQIALNLSISEHTVKFHSSSIYSKLGVTNRTEAVRQGVRMGLISF